MIALTIVAILLFLYGVIAFIINKADNQKLPLTVPSTIVGVVLFVLSSSIIKIGGQEVGVVILPWGVQEQVIETGWHLVPPFVSKIEYMDKTLWVYTLSSTHGEGQKKGDDAIWAPTKDGIQLKFDISVSWKIDASKAAWIYQNVSEADGTDEGRYRWIEENIMRAKIKSVLALTVSEYTPIEAYSEKRNQIQQEVYDKLTKIIAEYKLIVQDISIREVAYPPDFANSISQKKLAEQEALRLVEVTKQKEEQLKQASIDKDIVIQQAKGEAEALQIKGQSISNNPRIVDLEWIKRWDGKLPQYITGNNTSFLMGVPKM